MPLVALVDDLIFASRIEAVAVEVGAEVTVLRDAERLPAALDGCRGVLIDLEYGQVEPQQGRGDAIELIARIKQRWPDVAVVAYFPHVHVALKRAAERAGADRLLPRSRFVEQLRALLKELG